MMLQIPMGASAWLEHEDGSQSQYVYTRHFTSGYANDLGDKFLDQFSIPKPNQEISFVDIDDSLIYDYPVDSVILKTIHMYASTEATNDLTGYDYLFVRNLYTLSIDIDLSEFGDYDNITFDNMIPICHDPNLAVETDLREIVMNEVVTTELFDNTVNVVMTNNFEPSTETYISIRISFAYLVTWKPQLSMQYYLIIISAVTFLIVIGVLIWRIRKRK